MARSLVKYSRKPRKTLSQKLKETEMDESMGEVRKEVTLAAKVVNHREVLRALKERLETAERRIKQLESEVYGSSKPLEKTPPGLETIY